MQKPAQALISRPHFSWMLRTFVNGAAAPLIGQRPERAVREGHHLWGPTGGRALLASQSDAADAALEFHSLREVLLFAFNQ